MEMIVLPSFLRHKLKLLSKCCVYKVCQCSCLDNLTASISFNTNMYSKTCLKRSLKKNTKNGFRYRLSLNAGQKYCRMILGEHSAILSTFIKLPVSIKTRIRIFEIYAWVRKYYLTQGILSRLSRLGCSLVALHWNLHT